MTQPLAQRVLGFGRRLIGRHSDGPPAAYDPAWEPVNTPMPTFPGVISQACTQSQLESTEYQRWATLLDERPLMHRKQWEWCYIVQALTERGCVAPGRTGLGFGVGTEPITAYLAQQGCDILATDLASDDKFADHWELMGEHARDLSSLNDRGLCPPEDFAQRVGFRPLDMRAIPSDVRDFDFTWSSCALEHLGSLDAGWDFVRSSLDCLKPGGIAVHTTEFNVSSNIRTIERGPTVVYRRKDVEALVGDLRSEGHGVEATFALGAGVHDRHIDAPPWSKSHLKVYLGSFVLTSFGIVIQKRRD